MKKEPDPARELQKLQTWAIKFVKNNKERRENNKMSSKIIQALKAVDYKDVAVRALWTFAQAFLAVFLFAAEQIIDTVFAGNWEDAYALIIATGVAGIAAGLSALKTVIISIVKDLKKNV